MLCELLLGKIIIAEGMTIPPSSVAAVPAWAGQRNGGEAKPLLSGPEMTAVQTNFIKMQ